MHFQTKEISGKIEDPLKTELAMKVRQEAGWGLSF